MRPTSSPKPSASGLSRSISGMLGNSSGQKITTDGRGSSAAASMVRESSMTISLCVYPSVTQTRSNWLCCRAKWLKVGGGPGRNRTDVQGFAVLCMTTLPPGRRRPLYKERARQRSMAPAVRRPPALPLSGGTAISGRGVQRLPGTSHDRLCRRPRQHGREPAAPEPDRRPAACCRRWARCRASCSCPRRCAAAPTATRIWRWAAAAT